MMAGAEIVELLKSNGFDAIFGALPDTVFAFDVGGNLVYANSELRDRLGVDADSYDSPFGTLVDPERREEVRAHFERAISGQTVQYTTAGVLPGGARVRVQVVIAPLRSHGEVVAVVGMARDIEELEISREQSTALQTELERVLNSISDGFYFFSHDWTFSYVNPRGQTIAQRSAEELLGRSLWDVFPDMYASEFGIAYRSAVAESRTVSVRDHYEALGSWLEATAYPTPDGLAVYVRDVSVEEEARQQLIETQNQLAAQGALLDVAHDAIIVRSLGHVIRYWNAAASRIYGWTAEEAVGASARELLYASDEGFVEAAAATLRDGHWSGELIQRTKSGGTLVADSSWTLVVSADGEPESIFTVNTNITERKRQEAILLRAQRLNSLGTFAGGIAHDLNNVLTPILTSAQLLAEGETDPGRLQMLAAIETSAIRGAEMIRQVLSFARGVEGKRVRIEALELLGEFGELCASTLPKSIEVTVDAGEHPRDVLGDRTQLLQVLMNLAVNARDAMPGGGHLTVSARSTEVDGVEAERQGVTAGPFTVITVEDTGVGMSADTISRIFEPFFTTKAPGSGTGLGLATSQAIMSGHGGYLRVYSEPGHGSRFELFLPSTPAVVEDEEQSRDTSEVLPPRGDGQLVLIVDDEQEIRASTRRVLEAHGYSVAVASQGQDAIDYLNSGRSSVDLVLTDIMMPVMDGIALAHALAVSHPDLPIVAMSGLNGNAGRVGAERIVSFLTKPFGSPDLLRAVHDALTRGRGMRDG